MGITTRDNGPHAVNRKLTIAEMDENFNYLEGLDTSISINLNFEEPKSYNYITPYDLVISSYQTSTPMTVDLSISSVTYILGATISQYSDLLITTDTAGLIILNGYKI